MEITYAGAITGIFLIIFAATIFAVLEGSPDLAIAVDVMKLLAMVTVVLVTARVALLMGRRSPIGKLWLLGLAGFILLTIGEFSAATYDKDKTASGILLALGSVILIVAVFAMLRQFELMIPRRAALVALIAFLLVGVMMAVCNWRIMQSGLSNYDKVRYFFIPFFDLAALIFVIGLAFAFFGSGLEKAWVFFMQGILAMLSADLIIGYLKLAQGYTVGTADLLYIIGWMLIAVGVFLYRFAPLEGRRPTVR